MQNREEEVAGRWWFGEPAPDSCACSDRIHAVVQTGCMNAATTNGKRALRSRKWLPLLKWSEAYRTYV